MLTRCAVNLTRSVVRLSGAFWSKAAYQQMPASQMPTSHVSAAIQRGMIHPLNYRK
jgi:hypothetical protein